MIEQGWQLQLPAFQPVYSQKFTGEITLKSIKFVKSASPYQTDDVAGFDNDVADKYIKDGYAVPYSKRKSAEKEEEPAPPAPVVPPAD